MSTTSEREPFVAKRFIEDIKQGCAELDAPYSEAVINEVIEAYGESLYDAAVQLKGGSRPGSTIQFRILFAIPLDTLEIALRQGWLTEADPMVQLHRALKAQFPRHIEQPEFLVDSGCDAMFHYLNELSPLDKVLAVPALPDAVRANRQRFLDLGLDTVIVVHNHYRKKQVSFYFLAKGPLTKDALNKYAAMCGCPEPSDAIYNDIIGLLLDQSYYLTVVMDFDTGRIIRIEFHLFFPVKLPDDMEIPDVGDRIAAFWDIPSYEVEDIDILSYCFGECPEGQIVGYRSHCGGLRHLMKSWGIVGV